jgi:glutathione S-transferase
LKARYEPDEEKKKVLTETLIGTYIPFWLGAIENRLKNNSTNHYLVGDKISIADFGVTALIYSFFVNEANDSYSVMKPIIDSFENVKAYYENMGSVELKEYLEKRPKPRPF